MGQYYCQHSLCKYHQIFEDSLCDCDCDCNCNSLSASPGGGGDSSSSVWFCGTSRSVRFSGTFSLVRFSGNYGVYIDRIPASAYCHYFGSSSNRAPTPSGE